MSAPLIAVPPLTIIDARLVSTNVPETDYGVYNPATTYALGARVILTTGVHLVYESVQASNLGKDPALATSATWWKKVGATNAWRCLDTKVSTQTVQAGGMSYRFTPGKVVSVVYLGNVQADSVRVRMIDPVAGTVYDKTTSLLGSVRRARPYDWYFSRRVRKTRFLALNLPAYYGADILVDVVAAGDAAVGVLMLGYPQALGRDVKLGVRVGIDDYSRKIRNDYGDDELVQLAFADRAEFDLVVDNSEIDSLKDQLTDLRATPCLWIGSSLYACTIVFGWYSNFEILIPYNVVSDCNLSLKGLT